MGRHTGPEYISDHPDDGPITLRRIRLNSGGYDSGGAYWGYGAPLFWAADKAGNEMFFRAGSRESAKEELREMFGALKFYR
jgi:hypothetical protein